VNFQQLILALQSFWAQQGCIIAQPYDVEKGAGTGNPHTYLRALGPEPWNVAYVEPCRRPTDGRYGENPNRLGAYYQFQVLLKPSPSNVLDRYLRSLTAMGIRPRDHDIRFVEDDWEQATLGAWGLGWEVWLDGMEITQFTYFQQVGGIECKPVAAEITYGLERIAMYLQGVDNILDLEWGGGFTYRDVHHQTEVEWSKYNFEHAEPKVLLELFEHFRGESERLNELGLVFPAYDSALKASHTFNTLEARGAISVSERAAFLGRIRDLSRKCAETFYNEREKLGWPILQRNQTQVSTAGMPAVEMTQEVDATAARLPTLADRDFLLEIGCEEIPARFLAPASKAFAAAVTGWMDESGLAHGEATTWYTPRRIVLSIADVAHASARSEELVTGPPARIAFDNVGAPKIPAIKFAEGQGVAVEDLERIETPKGEYLAVRREVGGELALDLLEEALPGLLAAIPWPKSMRWGSREERFARPLHWIVALLAGNQLRFQFAGIQSGNLSRGHRFFGDETFAVWDRDSLFEGLSSRHVTLDPAERQRIIAGQLNQEAGELGGEPVHDNTLLEHVVGLVEAPRVVSGSYDERYLALPREVVQTILTYHQKMFAVDNGEGQLLPKFLGVSNNPTIDQPNTRTGYEKVVSARLADGMFFFELDRKRSLADHVEDLERRTFLKGVGSLGAKAKRLEALARTLGEATDPASAGAAARAALLAKADLCTSLVGEFPELQGVIGRVYATLDGEEPLVSEAVFEHYLPRGGDDLLPITAPGSLAALADKADTMAACFALGKIPTGSADPYGLRRAAIGILRILQAREMHLPVSKLIEHAVDGVGFAIKGERADVEAKLADFLRGRLKVMWAADFGTDLAEAVLLAGWDDVADAHARVEALAEARGGEDFAGLMESFKRMGNLLRKAGGAEGDPSAALFSEAAEGALHTAFEGVRGAVATAMNVQDYPIALAAMASLRAPLASFFDDVMVLCDDPEVSQNRLRLLAAIHEQFGALADFSAVSTD